MPLVLGAHLGVRDPSGEGAEDGLDRAAGALAADVLLAVVAAPLAAPVLVVVAASGLENHVRHPAGASSFFFFS